MVETEGMEQLVLDGVMVETTLTVQRHCLAITTATDIGVTPIDRLDVQVVSLVGSWDEANAGDVLE